MGMGQEPLCSSFSSWGSHQLMDLYRLYPNHISSWLRAGASWNWRRLQLKCPFFCEKRHRFLFQWLTFWRYSSQRMPNFSLTFEPRLGQTLSIGDILTHYVDLQALPSQETLASLVKLASKSQEAGPVVSSLLKARKPRSTRCMRQLSAFCIPVGDEYGYTTMNYIYIILYISIWSKSFVGINFLALHMTSSNFEACQTRRCKLSDT